MLSLLAAPALAIEEGSYVCHKYGYGSLTWHVWVWVELWYDDNGTIYDHNMWYDVSGATVNSWSHTYTPTKETLMVDATSWLGDNVRVTAWIQFPPYSPQTGGSVIFY